MKYCTRPVKIGDIVIGGGAPIVVQSMTTTKTFEVEATVNQVDRLEKAGCEIIRVAVPDLESAKALEYIKEEIKIPLVADVHFRPSLALAALDHDIDKIRINPGTIRDLKKVKEIVLKAKEKNIPIRIGVNSGSLHPKYKGVENGLPQALVSSVLEYAQFFEALDFTQIVISVKSSSVMETIEANQILAEKTKYPLHLGITEAGTLLSGSIKSSVGMGVLLFQGIGDTIRVSLAADPVEEVEVAHKILSALGLRNRGPEIIACPTCGRSEINLIPVAVEVEQKLSGLTAPIKIAVMGCEVNGPGEAREADIGVAGGKNGGLLFKKGKIIKKLSPKQMVPSLVEEAKRLAAGSKKEGRD